MAAMEKISERQVVAESVSSSEFRIAVIHSRRTDSGDGGNGQRRSRLKPPTRCRPLAGRIVVTFNKNPGSP